MCERPPVLRMYPVSIRPAAGCKYFLTIRPVLSVLHSSVGLVARVGSQAGFATSRTLGCAQAGFATSRMLGCAQVGFATSRTLGCTQRTLGCTQVGFATSRTLGCAQVGFATSWTLGLGLGFGIDFGFIMALNTVAIDLNT